MKYKTYPKYKDSGVEWIGKVPEGWEVDSLKRFSSKITDGSHFSPIASDEGYPYITVSDVKDDKVDIENSAKISKEDFEQLKRNGCQPNVGDILLSKDGTIGKCVVVSEDNKFVVLSSLGIISLRKDIHPEHMRYYLISDANIKQMFSRIRGSAITRLTIQLINDLIVIIPPVKEQLSVTSFLDKKTAEIDALIDKDRRLIDLLREKRASLINHAVTKGLDPKAKMKESGVEWIGEIPEGWDVRRINKLSYVRRGASPRPIDDPKYFSESGEYSWVRIEDVTASDKYLLETYEKLSLLGKSFSVPLEPGEIFISIAGSVGKPIITKIKCCIHDGFVYFQRLKIHPDYLYYIFINGEAYKGLGKLGTQLNLNTETIGEIRIPLPPKPEQIAIANYIDKQTARLDSTISKIETKIALLSEYKKSLIHSAVTGSINVISKKNDN